jgi:hypothetical protein
MPWSREEFSNISVFLKISFATGKEFGILLVGTFLHGASGAVAGRTMLYRA